MNGTDTSALAAGSEERVAEHGGYGSTKSWAATATAQPVESYFLLILRIYHFWCMCIGLLMVVAITVQAALAIFEEFLSTAWTESTSSPGLALVASIAVSIIVVDVATSLCCAAVSLMFDSWHPEPFVAFRSLLVFDPVCSRLGVPEQIPKTGRRKQADFAAQVFIYASLDALPVFAAVVAGDGSLWKLWVAIASVALVIMFWILDIIHDYVCKAEALRRLLGRSELALDMLPDASHSEPEASFPEIPAVDVVAGNTGTEQEGTPSNQQVWWQSRSYALSGFVAVIIVVLWVAGIALKEQILDIIAGCATFVAVVNLISLGLTRKLGLIKVRPYSREQHDAVCACVDDSFLVTSSVSTDEWEIPRGAQLVSDGFMTSGAVRSQLGGYPLGAVLWFRREVMPGRSVFLETYCGAGPLYVAVNALLTTCWFLPCAFVMVRLNCFRLLVGSAVGFLAYLSPAICLLLAPRLSAPCHVLVSLSLTLFALILGMAASHPSGFVFWVIPFLCLASHGLLHRRFHHNVVVAASIALLSAFVLFLYFFLSLSATFQSPFIPEPEVMSRTFTFADSGARNPYNGSFATSPACSLQYPTSLPSYSLGLVDFGFFNKVVYEPDGALESQLSHWMGDWKLVKSERRELRCKNAASCSSADWTSWFVFEGKTPGLENTTVITIRGTKSFLEIIYDLDLWSLDILGLKSLASHIPGVGQVVNGFWSSPKVGSVYYKWKLRRFKGVRDYLHHRVVTEPHRVFYLSGHSLGGGLAQLIAAEETLRRIPVVAISAPGVVETANQLGLDPGSLQGLAVNIIPQKDPVPIGAGKQGGTFFEIPCLADGVACHRVFNTVCELMRECGDGRHRVLPCNFCPLESNRRAKLGLAPECAEAPAQRRTPVLNEPMPEINV